MPQMETDQFKNETEKAFALVLFSGDSAKMNLPLHLSSGAGPSFVAAFPPAKPLQ